MLPRRSLGSSGLEVCALGLGGNVFGPPRLDVAQTRDVVDAAIDAGVDFVDTAIVYGEGHSEEFLGEVLVGRRDRFVIATKFNLKSLGEASIAAHVRAQAETSLRRLNSDVIDLYQIHHAPNDDRTMIEVLTVLGELIAEGKVRAIGACNISSWRLAEAVQVARDLSVPSFVTVQNYWHLLARGVESEVVPYASKTGIGILPYHPLAGGYLSGKYEPGKPRPEGTRGAAGSPIIETVDSATNFAMVSQLTELAAAHGRSVAELAIAWLVAQPSVSSVIAGVSNPAQLAQNVRGASWHLDAEVLARIDEITAPQGIDSPERMPYRVRTP